MALLETKSLTKSFGALTAVNGVTPRRRGRLAAFDHRPERRRQDHALQPAHRHLPADLGRDPFRRQKDITGTPGAPRRPPRPRALVPAHQRVSRLLAPRQRLDRRLRHAAHRGRACCGSKPSDYPEVARARQRRPCRTSGSRRKANQLAREISHGEQRQLELAIALAAAPRVLLLDEPAAGLSPEETRKDGGAGALAQGPLHHRADRAQDGHHHERVGPHLGDALRQRSSPRARPQRSSAIPRCAAPIWAG